MAEHAHDPPAVRPARVDRHRLAMPANPIPVSPAVDRRAAPRPAPALPAVDDKTSRAVRRPALLSDRCTGCGASTLHRAGMVTELVEAGPIRALRVVACSACPERRRRGSGL